MGRKNRTKSRPVSDMGECRESKESIQLRLEKAKKQLDIVSSLAYEEVFDYDVRDEIVGKVYMSVLHHQRDLDRFKVEEKLRRKRG